MAKSYKIKLDQYDSLIEVIFGKDMKDCFSTQKTLIRDGRYNPEGQLGATLMYADGDTGKKRVVVMIAGGRGEKLDRVIAHECFHVVIDICSILGINIDINNQEAPAYLMEYLFSEIKACNAKYMKFISDRIA